MVTDELRKSTNSMNLQQESLFIVSMLVLFDLLAKIKVQTLPGKFIGRECRHNASYIWGTLIYIVDA